MISGIKSLIFVREWSTATCDCDAINILLSGFSSKIWHTTSLMNVVFPVPGGPCNKNKSSAVNAFSKLFNFELSIYLEWQSFRANNIPPLEVAFSGSKIRFPILGLIHSLNLTDFKACSCLFSDISTIFILIETSP